MGRLELKLDPNLPIYQQLMDSICHAVARGELKPGEKIPSQRDLAEGARVNPNTVQRAYRELELLGLVETRRGEGTFIRDDPTMLDLLRTDLAKESVRRFIRELRALGLGDTEIRQLTETALKGDEQP